MASHSVTLVDGPADGNTVLVDDPWPRYGNIIVTVGLEQYAYQMSGDETPPYTADYVDADAVPPDETDTTGEGIPGPTGPTGPEGPAGPQGEPGEPGDPVEHQGDWDVATSYEYGDIVNHDDASWFSTLSANTGNEPGTVPGGAMWEQLLGGGGGGSGEVYEQLTEPSTTTVGAIWIVQAP